MQGMHLAGRGWWGRSTTRAPTLIHQSRQHIADPPPGVANSSVGAGLCTGGAEAVNFSRLSFQRAMVGVKLGL